MSPISVAQGMLATIKNEDDPIEVKQTEARVMDLIAANVPNETFTSVSKTGKKTVREVPLYNAVFTEPMIKEIEANYKSLSVEKAHNKRVINVCKFLSTYEPTIPLNESLYRLSFYLIPNKNNLAKSTNNLIDFAKRILKGSQNNMLVDSALLIGGQGKSTVQQGLKNAVEEMGFSAGSCQLPTIRDGTQESFVKHEVCIDEDTKFEKVDYESLNKILDKGNITIKGKYVKEWSAKSIANILVGTNYLPNDVNARRYSIRMVDENFKLTDNYGRWGIPGSIEDDFSSYEKVVEWTTEAWINLFYYVNKYDIKPLTYSEKSFDYGLIYRLNKAFENQPTNEATIQQVVKFFEQTDGDKLDWKAKQNFSNKLFMLANQLKLPVVGVRKHNMYNVYDWNTALEIEESTPDDPLETIYCWFHNNENFKTPEKNDSDVLVEPKIEDSYEIEDSNNEEGDTIENSSEEPHAEVFGFENEKDNVKRRAWGLPTYEEQQIENKLKNMDKEQLIKILLSRLNQ